MARGRMATGGMTRVMGDTTKARVSRATGSTTMATGGTVTLHNEGNAPQDNGDGQQDDGRHNDGTGQHSNGRHNDGKGSRAAGQWVIQQQQLVAQ